MFIGNSEVAKEVHNTLEQNKQQLILSKVFVYLFMGWKTLSICNFGRMVIACTAFWLCKIGG